MWANRSDEELLRALPRQPGAFSAFYRRHVNDVLGFLARRCRDPEQAADLTADGRGGRSEPGGDPAARQPRAGRAAYATGEGDAVTFVDRLEDELIRAGYSRSRRRRAPAVAGVIALVCAGAVLAFALRTNASPGPAKPEHAARAPRGATRPSTRGC
jgi:hypothetical protein